MFFLELQLLFKRAANNGAERPLFLFGFFDDGLLKGCWQQNAGGHVAARSLFPFHMSWYNMLYYTIVKKGCKIYLFLLFSVAMPNMPAENTVSTSFTLPRGLMEAIEHRSKIEMTNKSEQIRRALMNYLTTDERAQVLREMAAPGSFKPVPEKNVSYRKGKSRKRRKT
jgi:hypothetical protein